MLFLLCMSFQEPGVRHAAAVADCQAVFQISSNVRAGGVIGCRRENARSSPCMRL